MEIFILKLPGNWTHILVPTKKTWMSEMDIFRWDEVIARCLQEHEPDLNSPFVAGEPISCLMTACNSEVRKRSAYSSRNRWKLRANPSLTLLFSGWVQLPVSPPPTAYPQLGLFCTVIKDKIHQTKRENDRSGKIKVTSLGFMETEESKNEAETEIKRKELEIRKREKQLQKKNVSSRIKEYLLLIRGSRYSRRNTAHLDAWTPMMPQQTCQSWFKDRPESHNQSEPRGVSGRISTESSIADNKETINRWSAFIKRSSTGGDQSHLRSRTDGAGFCSVHQRSASRQGKLD